MIEEERDADGSYRNALGCQTSLGSAVRQLPRDYAMSGRVYFVEGPEFFSGSAYRALRAVACAIGLESRVLPARDVAPDASFVALPPVAISSGNSEFALARIRAVNSRARYLTATRNQFVLYVFGQKSSWSSSGLGLTSVSTLGELAVTCDDAPPLLSAERVGALRRLAQAEEVIRLQHELKRGRVVHTRQEALRVLEELACRYSNVVIPKFNCTSDELRAALQVARDTLRVRGEEYE